MEQYRITVKGILRCGDKFLIVKKWYDDRIVNPYQWEFIDGKVLFGEQPDMAVMRHVTESTGAYANIDRILYTWTYMLGDVCNLGIAYLCDTKELDITISEDLHDYKWVTIKEIGKYIENKRMLDDFKRALNQIGG